MFHGKLPISMAIFNSYVSLYAPWCWDIYLHDWVNFNVNVGKYTIHGAFGKYSYMAN